MLSNKKLLDALHAYISKNGIGSLLNDRHHLPLSPILPIPSFLVNSDASKQVLAHNSRVASTESITNKALRTHEEESNSDFELFSNNNTFFEEDSKGAEELESFLRSNLNCTDLIVKFDSPETQIYDEKTPQELFPFAFDLHKTTLKIECSLPTSTDATASESTASATIHYVKGIHTIIGPEYNTFSNIEVRANDEEHADSVQSKKIDGTFLYKAGTALSPKDNDDLANGRAPMLLSLESEMRILTARFLCDSTVDGVFQNNSNMQQHALKLIARLMTGGTLSYNDIKILNIDTSYTPDDSVNDGISIKSTCTATVSLGEQQNTEMEIVFVGTVAKSHTTEERTYFHVPKYEITLNSKDESLLKTFAGSGNTKFVDAEKGIYNAMIGERLTADFLANAKKIIADKQKSVTATKEPDNSTETSTTTQEKVVPATDEAAAAEGSKENGGVPLPQASEEAPANNPSTTAGQTQDDKGNKLEDNTEEDKSKPAVSTTTQASEEAPAGNPSTTAGQTQDDKGNKLVGNTEENKSKPAVPTTTQASQEAPAGNLSTVASQTQDDKGHKLVGNTEEDKSKPAVSTTTQASQEAPAGKPSTVASQTQDDKGNKLVGHTEEDKSKPAVSTTTQASQEAPAGKPSTVASQTQDPQSSKAKVSKLVGKEATKSKVNETSTTEQKPSLLRRILGIPVSIVKFIFNVIVKCVTFPFSLVARCCSKVVGLFCSKPSSTDASLNSTSQTTAVASDTSKGQSTETNGKVAPTKDKGGASPVEHHKQAASAGPAKETTIAPRDLSKGQSTETNGKVAPTKDKGGASPVEHHKQAASAGPAKETTITSNVKSDAPDSVVKAPTIAANQSSKTSSVEISG